MKASVMYLNIQNQIYICPVGNSGMSCITSDPGIHTSSIIRLLRRSFLAVERAVVFHGQEVTTKQARHEI
jgi:hypothetical protein